MNANVFRLFLYIYEHVYFANAGKRQTEDIKTAGKHMQNYVYAIRSSDRNFPIRRKAVFKW